MNPFEFALFAVLIAILLALAGVVGSRQLRTLRGLAARPDLSNEDRSYQRRQARRRLTTSVLMIVLAGMLLGYFFLHPAYKDVAAQVEGRGQRANPEPIAPEHKAFLRLFVGYWVAALLVLLAILFLAVFDFWAIARHGLSSHRKLQADHRALLQADVERYRQRRTGNGEA
ncbi:MAG: hypothetical protein IT429_23330 [Gemmataceae bacterium]|nr:hypothetical protein [Gemmataceae bacterium]